MKAITAIQRLGWPVYGAFALVIIVLAMFAVMLVKSGNNPTPADPGDTAAVAERLLAQGDAERGQALLEQYACVTCHFDGSGIAPSFTGLSDRAAGRDPSRSAIAYIYESIVRPTAFVVPGYTPTMPQNYGDRISEQELADILAHLMTR